MPRSGSGWIIFVLLSVFALTAFTLLSILQTRRESQEFRQMLEGSAKVDDAGDVSINFASLQKALSQNNDLNQKRYFLAKNIFSQIKEIQKRVRESSDSFKEVINSDKGGLSSFESLSEGASNLLPLSDSDKDEKLEKRKIKLYKKLVRLLDKLYSAIDEVEVGYLYLYLNSQGNEGNYNKQVLKKMREIGELASGLNARLPRNYAQFEKQLNGFVLEMTGQYETFTKLRNQYVSANNQILSSLKELDQGKKVQEEVSEARKVGHRHFLNSLNAKLPNVEMRGLILAGCLTAIFLILLWSNFRVVSKKKARQVLEKLKNAWEKEVDSVEEEQIQLRDNFSIASRDIYQDCVVTEQFIDSWVTESEHLNGSSMRYPLQIQKMINKIRLEVKMLLRLSKGEAVHFPEDQGPIAKPPDSIKPSAVKPIAGNATELKQARDALKAKKRRHSLDPIFKIKSD